MEYDMHARAHAGEPFASQFAMQYSSQQQQNQTQQQIPQQQHQSHQQQQHPFQVQQPHNGGSAFMYPFNAPQAVHQQQSAQHQGVSNAQALAVQQPYASWGSGALLNLATTRRARPQPITAAPQGLIQAVKHLKSPGHDIAQLQRTESTEVQSQPAGQGTTTEEQWTQKRPLSNESQAYSSTMGELAGSLSGTHGDLQMLNLGHLRGLDQDQHMAGHKSFQRESESRRPSQLSDSTYATTRLTTPDMMHPSDSDWASADRPTPLQRSNMSPIESPATAAMRPGSRSRASPIPHNNVRASPYTLESNRRLRWSTGMTVPSQAPPRFPPYQQNNRYSSYFGYSPLNPHNGLTSVSNEQGITTFAAPGQSLAYSQRMSMGQHFMMHPHMFAEQQHHLPPQPMYPLLPSDNLHGYSGNYADMSDPPDLFASLHEKPSEPPEEDMNPSDPDMVPHEQELRFAGDLYTPRWVRGHGNKREGWCGLCKPGRWLVLKNSAYWYDKSFTHGVCAQTGAAFAAPEATRRVEGNVDAWEGLCGHCGEWLSLVSSKKKGPTTWFRHVSKPKDVPKRRRGTNRRSTLVLSGSDMDDNMTGEVQPSGEHMVEVEGMQCDHHHDDHHTHSQHQHDDLHSHGQHDNHAQYVFGHPVSVEDSKKPLLSPGMISPRTVNIHAASTSVSSEFMSMLSEQEYNSQDVHVAIPKDDQSALDTLEEPTVKSEEHQYTEAKEENAVEISAIVTSVKPTFVIESAKTATPTQAVQAPPSPALTPISTPQLSETSISTPQMDVPTQNNVPIVGLGVHHILTGIPEQESNDFDFGELSRLEELYGSNGSSDGLLDHSSFACEDGGDGQHDHTTSEAAADKMDMSYNNSTSQQSDDHHHHHHMPAPSSLADNVCMSSQFDMMSAYPEQHEDHDVHGKHPFSDDMLQMHMGMQIALSGDNGEVTSLTSDSYWSAMEQ